MNIVEVDSKKLIKAFIKFPFQLYQDDPYWVAPLIMEQKNFFNKKKNPFFEHSEAQLFIAYKNDKIAGRISAHTNTQHNRTHNDKIGFFGFFECINDQKIANLLFDTAKEWLWEKGMNTLRGPANFSVNDECGLLINAFDSSPMLMMTYNPEYYISLFENYGLKKTINLNQFCEF